MEAPTMERKKRVHQGRNMRIAREDSNMTQEAVADKAGLHQSDISRMECMPVIEDEAKLQKVADALGCPVAFIKEHSLEETMTQYNTANTNLAENTQTSCNQGNANVASINEQVNYYYSDKIEALYEKLLAEKDKKIQELEARLTDK